MLSGIAFDVGLMNANKFRNPQGYILTIVLITLVLLAAGPARLTGEPALAASDPVIAAAGDIACDPASDSFNNGEGNPTSCRQKYTSDLLLDADLAAILPLGDVQYECGGYQAFLQSYDPTWGRVKSISHPVIGNHEYLTSGGTDCTKDNTGAAGYFRYFGVAAGDPSQGYYSYDIGAWHLIALNSNCEDAGGCNFDSPQGRWLRTDLVAHRSLCTLAYWHIPLFSSGGRTAVNTQTIWEILYANDVDVVLTGHDHIYERFAPQTADGTLDPERGIRSFVVGTGGSNHTELEIIAPNSEVRDTETYGVLKLTLHPDSYDWQFVPEEGQTFTDAGTDKCHGDAPSDVAGSVTPTTAETSAITPLAPAVSMFAFEPAADAYVSKTKPDSNFGASNLLRLYGGPLGASYLRFEIQGLSGNVARATLRLYAHTPSISGYQIHGLPNGTWTESSITYDNAPPPGDLITFSEPFDAHQWTQVDLTPLIKGNGTYNMVLLTFNGMPLSFASQQAISPYHPQLVVEVFEVAPSNSISPQSLNINSVQ